MDFARERYISFLQKPYTLPDLLRAVDDVLHAKGQAVLNWRSASFILFPSSLIPHPFSKSIPLPAEHAARGDG